MPLRQYLQCTHLNPVTLCQLNTLDELHMVWRVIKRSHLRDVTLILVKTAKRLLRSFTSGTQFLLLFKSSLVHISHNVPVSSTHHQNVY